MTIMPLACMFQFGFMVVLPLREVRLHPDKYLESRITCRQALTASGDAVDDRTSHLDDATSRTFFSTGVQMEIGATATEFESRTFGDELALCQRYCTRQFYQTLGRLAVQAGQYPGNWSNGLTTNTGLTLRRFLVQTLPTSVFLSWRSAQALPDCTTYPNRGRCARRQH